MQESVFLGGTTSLNNWRIPFIEQLVARGIDRAALFNPIVEHWTPEIRAKEKAMKADPRVIKVFYLGDTGKHNGIFISVYSVVEAILSLINFPDTTAVMFDVEGLTPQAAKRLMASHDDIRAQFPAAAIYTKVSDLEDWTFALLKVT